jgi:hypothetical protein
LNLDEVRSLPARELADVLDQLGVAAGWVVGDTVRAAASGLQADEPSLSDPSERQNQAFQNLIVGTLAERVFRDEHLAALELEGFSIEDYHEAGENRDYGLQRDGAELPINVKTASTRFETAQRTVGLDPDDCIPISAYKAIGASERVPGLVYVDLVDFTLRERVDRFMSGLEGPVGVGWHLFAWYAGRGARRAQDAYLNALFDSHADALKELAPGATQFRVISAQRVLAIMRENPRRVPGLGVRGAGTGSFVAEVNVHVSVANETRPWGDVAEDCRRRGISAVLDDIRKTRRAEVPDPML